MKHYKYVIIGSGIAAGYAAQEFVQQNVGKGDLAIITADSVLPTTAFASLSKGFLSGEKSREDILLKDSAFYRENGILVKTRTSVVNVDLTLTAPCAANPPGTVGYEKLLIATGSEVRRLNVPGANLKGLFICVCSRIRKPSANKLKRANGLWVIGSGFIGMEVASVLAKAGQAWKLRSFFRRIGFRSKFFTPEMSSWFSILL